jgi:hypothetical protein
MGHLTVLQAQAQVHVCLQNYRSIYLNGQRVQKRRVRRPMWDSNVIPPPSRFSPGNKPTGVPARQDFVVTYWVTVGSGDRKIHVPIEPKQVAGSEKDIVNGGMKKGWQWVQDKKTEDKVSLQDVFDLAQEMHSDTEKTGSRPDNYSGSNTLFRDIYNPGDGTWRAETCADNTSSKTSSRTSTKNKKKKQNHDNTR